MKKKILITGGAGFLGSHLADKLIQNGNNVIVLDNYFTGNQINISHLLNSEKFTSIEHDIVHPFYAEADEIYHLACPASPIHYQLNPIKTIKTSVLGTINALGLAKRLKAKILLASTSEVYGDPQITPQSETYWGNVNPIGPRSCYDEGKRCAESLFINYNKQNNVDIRIARIFNTYGPRMHPHDGRVVSNFIMQALENKDITLYGTGKQTRSFCYVSDMVDGLIKLMSSTKTHSLPVNLGNPSPISIIELANLISNKIASSSQISFKNLPEDDPLQRHPDISLAKKLLDWQPTIDLETGLDKTIQYFKSL